MPLLSGLELVRQLLLTRPGLKVIFLTGRPDEDILLGPGIFYLKKPFALKGLLARVEHMLLEH